MPKVNMFPRIFGEDGSTGEAFPGKRGSADRAGWRVETARVVRGATESAGSQEAAAKPSDPAPTGLFSI